MAEETKELITTDKANIPIENGHLVPKDLNGLWRLAVLMADSGMVPKEYAHKPAAICVAVQLGMEVGLAPMQSVQNIAVIHGKPSIYGDGITGLLHGSGKCEHISEFFEKDGKVVDPADLPLNLDEWSGVKAISEIKRKGTPKPYRGTFSVNDAIRMGKWNKAYSTGEKSTWQKHPARMLLWRARAFAARDGFSDVLKGLSVFEEVADYDADLKKANGQYQVVEAAAVTPTEFDTMVQENDLDAGLVQKYLELCAKTASVSVGVVMDGAIQQKEGFVNKFRAWAAKSNADAPTVPTSEIKEEPASCPNCDIPNCPGCKTVEVGETPDKDIFKMFEQICSERKLDPSEYEEYFKSYLDYVSQMTKLEHLEVCKRFLEDTQDKWFDFFIKWHKKQLQSSGPAGTSKDTGAKVIDFPPKNSTPPADESLDNGANPPPESNETTSSDKDGGAVEGDEPPAPLSFISEWIGMPGTRFREYVPANPDKFKGISVQEYDRARDKWDKYVYSRWQEKWPLDDSSKQEPIKFPEQNTQQRFLAAKMNNPDAVKKSLEFRGFANTPATDEAKEIVLKDVLDIMGGKVLKK